MTMMNFVSHGTQDMYPTFLQRDCAASRRRSVAVIAMIYNVGAIIGGIVDRLLLRPHRPAPRDGDGAAPGDPGDPALGVRADASPLLVVGAFVLQFMVQGAWGVIPAHINELSPDSVRGFLPGFAYQCGVLIAGTVAYIEAVFAAQFSYANAMAMHRAHGLHARRNRRVARP